MNNAQYSPSYPRYQMQIDIYNPPKKTQQTESRARSINFRRPSDAGCIEGRIDAVHPTASRSLFCAFAQILNITIHSDGWSVDNTNHAPEPDKIYTQTRIWRPRTILGKPLLAARFSGTLLCCIFLVFLVYDCVGILIEVMYMYMFPPNPSNVCRHDDGIHSSTSSSSLW